MVSGHLREKSGYYHIVLNYVDETGKRVSKWMSTGLKTKGNKKRAEQMLLETKLNYEIPGNARANKDGDELMFTDYIREWLLSNKANLETSTYASYEYQIRRICEYFEDKEIALKKLQPKDIQDFYTHAINEWGVTANTVIHFHANIRKALQYAVRMKMIQSNPALEVDRPRVQKFTGAFYDVDNINKLLTVVKGMKIELAVMLASFYGLRRSEIVGLKWDAIDFKNKTITIKHTVTQITINGKCQLITKDRAKTKASLRSLPLVSEFEEYLLCLRARQVDDRYVCGKSYNYDYDGYVYVDEMGYLIKPNYITQNFDIVLRNNGLRDIRFHDLRHSCASLLLANGVSLKEI